MMNEDQHFVVEGAPGIAVKIIDTKQLPRQDKPGKVITVFVIQITMFGKTWTVEKRYNHFLMLHQNLQERFPDAALFIVAKFPQRLIFHTDQDIYKRRLIFESYLEQALRDEKIRTCAHMKNFLQYPPHDENLTDPSAKLVATFFKAVGEKDIKTIAECYHEEIEFYEPSVGKLNGSKAVAFWSFFFSLVKDLTVQYDSIKINGDKGTAHWETWYTWTPTGNAVHNLIEAEFDFRNGKIYRHIDNYNMNIWAFQSEGAKYFGWTKKNREAHHERFESFVKNGGQPSSEGKKEEL